jgi:hypothetical protein
MNNNNNTITIHQLKQNTFLPPIFDKFVYAGDVFYDNQNDSIRFNVVNGQQNLIEQRNILYYILDENENIIKMGSAESSMNGRIGSFKTGNSKIDKGNNSETNRDIFSYLQQNKNKKYPVYILEEKYNTFSAINKITGLQSKGSFLKENEQLMFLHYVYHKNGKKIPSKITKELMPKHLTTEGTTQLPGNRQRSLEKLYEYKRISDLKETL